MKKLTKVQLLKVFTKIPNEFIDDYYSILSKKSDDFVVNLDTIAKWLNVRKDDLHDTLKKSYQKNVDYTVETVLRRTRGGSNYLKIMLTVDCFKRLCMRSRSRKAEDVRTYFIELDDFISHYSDQISDGIMKDIEKVARKIKKNPKVDGPGYIYAIRASAKTSSLLKIGETLDLVTRLRTYNIGRAEDVELLYAFRTTDRKTVEACIKGLMESKRYKKRKEIYEIDLDILKKIIVGCNKMSMDMKEVKSKSELDGKYYVLFMKSGGGELYNDIRL